MRTTDFWTTKTSLPAPQARKRGCPCEHALAPGAKSKEDVWLEFASSTFWRWPPVSNQFKEGSAHSLGLLFSFSDAWPLLWLWHSERSQLVYKGAVASGHNLRFTSSVALRTMWNTSPSRARHLKERCCFAVALLYLIDSDSRVSCSLVLFVNRLADHIRCLINEDSSMWSLFISCPPSVSIFVIYWPQDSKSN